ncbi:endonuclease/exonuclease/phosphatase family protein [Bacteroides nordii]|uniref:endonuclease/exonuclease/phosphatase family protein n=1 Tax=Bacteroides nordii TaxID=291645 RepID=UPI00248F64F8|nr:endonuclease/exonuclease/phosphatase family protein [Bacteroides nordii]
MLRKLFFVGAALLLSVCVSAQNYNKEKGAIRLLTYNTHYCKGATDPGELTKDNIENLGKVIKALDADVVALQELDSAAVGRGARYLLKEIADAAGSGYVPYYGNAAPFDGGSIGCGVLIKNTLPVKGIQVIHLPGDETRAAVAVELKNFIFIGTHSDLNDEKRREGAQIVCDWVGKKSKPVFLAGDLNDSHRWPNGGVSFPVWVKYFDIISDTTGNSIPGRTDSGALIDYVLLLKNRKASKVKVLRTHILRTVSVDGKSVDTATVSDHYPVFVDVKF